MSDTVMRKAITISLGVHLAAFAMFFIKGCTQTSVIAVPQVYQVQLIAMPEVQPAPPDEVVEQIEIETIPPPPEEKKRIQPKPKPEPPKPRQQAPQAKVAPTRPITEQAVSGIRSDEVFEYPYYISLMVNKIRSNWIKPSSGEIVVTIFFRVDRTGQISDIRVEKSSGIAALDRAAMRAVFNSNPLPPLPQDYREPRLTVHLDFDHEP